MQTLQGALLSCMYTVLDYAQTGLIAAVFFFKVRWLALFIIFLATYSSNNKPKVILNVLKPWCIVAWYILLA